MTVIVIGGSSGVGRALACEAASKGEDIIVAARNEADLVAVSKDIRLRYQVDCSPLVLDVCAENSVLAAFVGQCNERVRDSLRIFICAGAISSADSPFEISSSQIDQLCATNYVQLIKLIGLFIQSDYKLQSTPSLTVISSIAAPLSRSRNAVYAASKRALECYCRSIQHATDRSRWNVSVCRLGYVDTAMNFGQKVLLPVAAPEKVAQRILRMSPWRRLYYMPSYWGLIVLILQSLPWALFKKLKF